MENYRRNIADTLAALLTETVHHQSLPRNSVLKRVMQITEHKTPFEGVPADLSNYIDKIALCAYRVTDEDIKSLKMKGYSEDQIFEITLCAAMGAGLARMKVGLAALKGFGG